MRKQPTRAPIQCTRPCWQAQISFLHSAGWLEGGLCTGFEKLIMDADRLGSYQKLLSLGLDISDDALARDAYQEVGAGGHFLGCTHTMRHYQNAFYETALSDSENVESWEEAGSQDMRRRANVRRKKDAV